MGFVEDGMLEVDNQPIILMTKFTPVPFAEKLMNKYIFVYDKHKRFFMYDDDSGLWVSNAEQFVRTLLRKHLMGDDQQKKNYVEEVVSYIKDIRHDDDFDMDNCPHLIAFKNKVYDLRDGFFYEFRPEFKLTNKLDIEIDNEIKECPQIDKFFEDSVGSEYKQILYDLLAYTLYKDYPYQKIFFIYGSGSRDDYIAQPDPLFATK